MAPPRQSTRRRMLEKPDHSGPTPVFGTVAGALIVTSAVEDPWALGGRAQGPIPTVHFRHVRA